MKLTTTATTMAAGLLACSLPLFAATTGSISGTLKDPSGAVIAAGTVIVTNTAQGVQAKTSTDAKGAYSFPSLPVGTYDLKTDVPGFKTQTRAGLKIDIDSALQIDLTLELSQKTEEITVTDTDVHVDTESSQVGEVVASRDMTEVAFNGRSYTDLLALQPGIVPMSTQQPDSVVMAGATVAINPSGSLNPGNQSISGQREDATAYGEWIGR